MKVFAAFHTFSFLQSFQNRQSPARFRQEQGHHSYNNPATIAMAESCDNATKVPTLANGATASTLCDEYDDEDDSTNDTPTLISSILPPLPAGSRRIYLIRHGETDWNLQGKIQGGGFDIPLNENGRQQALKTALALEDIPLGVVASSHLSRAKETADILWRRHNSTVQDRRVILNGLAEMSFGEFEGLAWRDQEVDPALAERFKTISRQLKHDVEKAFPGGGESTRDVAARSTEALNEVLDSSPDHQHIAIVSHGRTNKVIIAATALGDVMQYPGVKQGSKFTNCIIASVIVVPLLTMTSFLQTLASMF
jgi:broad specificity phosphatase PhoE